MPVVSASELCPGMVIRFEGTLCQVIYVQDPPAIQSRTREPENLTTGKMSKQKLKADAELQELPVEKNIHFPLRGCRALLVDGPRHL